MNNKYLEKLAGMTPEDSAIGRVDKPLSAVAPGSRLVQGAKTLFAKANLHKMANTSAKHDLLNTATIGAAGGLTGIASNRLLHPNAKGGNAKAFAVSTGLGLLGDYAAVKLNKVINKHVQ